MRLHENQQLFADAIEAASRPVQDGGRGIKSIFIEKDYWICRSLSLMATGDKDNRAIFKGGTSLTKAYGIGAVSYTHLLHQALLDELGDIVQGYMYQYHSHERSRHV